MLWSGDGVSDYENHWKCTETLYGASFYISMKDCAKLGSQLGSRKLSNIYVSLSEVVWEWIVVPLQSNGQKTCCARQDHCLCIPSLEAGTRIMTDCLITHFYLFYSRRQPPHSVRHTSCVKDAYATEELNDV